MTQEQQPEDLENSGSATSIERLVYSNSRHRLAMFNILVAVYVGLPLLAPQLMNVAATGPARVN